MDVLHVVASTRRRGAEVFASDLVRELRAFGVDQAVAVVHHREAPQVLFDAPTHHLAETADGFSPLRHLSRSLRSLVKALEPAIVQAHGGEALKQAAVATRRTDSAVVYRRIGSTPQWMAGDLRRAAHRLVMRRADAIVAVADALRSEVIQEFSVAPERVVVIPNAVDITRALPERDRASVRALLGLNGRALIAIVVGALSAEKDPLSALDAATPALTANPFAHLVFVGDGQLRGALETAVRDRGVEKRVHLLGVREDIPDLLGASDVLLMSSRTEGMPAVAIEAGIAGLPVVAPRLSGLPEVVRDGTSGLLTAPGDTDALGRALVRLLGAPDERRALGAAGRDWCVANYDIKHVSARYLELYERLRPLRLLKRHA